MFNYLNNIYVNQISVISVYPKYAPNTRLIHWMMCVDTHFILMYVLTPLDVFCCLYNSFMIKPYTLPQWKQIIWLSMYYIMTRRCDYTSSTQFVPLQYDSIFSYVLDIYDFLLPCSNDYFFLSFADCLII